MKTLLSALVVLLSLGCTVAEDPEEATARQENTLARKEAQISLEQAEASLAEAVAALEDMKTRNYPAGSPGAKRVADLIPQFEAGIKDLTRTRDNLLEKLSE